MPIPVYSMKAALEQIAKCDFECEGGPLKNNVAWRWLNETAKGGPEFFPGQRVWFEITASAAGKSLSQWVEFTIVGCRMDSDEDTQFWNYDLSYDPPGPWHFGTTHFTSVSAGKLRLEKPEPVATTTR